MVLNVIMAFLRAKKARIAAGLVVEKDKTRAEAFTFRRHGEKRGSYLPVCAVYASRRSPYCELILNKSPGVTGADRQARKGPPNGNSSRA